MTRTDSYHGGLVFANTQDNVLDRFCRIIASTLEDYGHQVERQTVLDDTLARVVTHQHMVKVTLEPWSDFGSQGARAAALDEAAGLRARKEQEDTPSLQRVVFSITPVAPGEEDREVTELLLVVMLYRMVDAMPSKQIEWLDAGTVLTVDQFLSAFSNISPRRVRSRQEVVEPCSRRFASIDETEPGLAKHCAEILGRAPYAEQEGIIDLTDDEILALAFRTNPQTDEFGDFIGQPNNVQRLATWGITGMIAFISAPVAASVAAVNLARGEDLRLNTQVLAYSGFLTTVTGMGVL